MAYKLPIDCLNDIFEHLEEDKISLHSCLLVNHISWRNIWNFQHHTFYLCQPHKPSPSTILNTFIACLPNESKDLLHTNGMSIPAPTSKSPLFNYISFIKVFPIDTIRQILFLKNKQFNDSRLMFQELLKAFMNQISSLKVWSCSDASLLTDFDSFEVKDCLTDLSTFICHSNICPNFFNRLSQTCHNIQALCLVYEENISNELKGLIAMQRNLKYLDLDIKGKHDWSDIIPALTKHHHTLKRLYINVGNLGSLSFITSFKNLQKIL